MLRRWIIRAVFMLPILLCVGGWAWSGMYFSFVNYCRNGYGIQLSPSHGTIGVYLFWDSRNSNGWHGGIGTSGNPSFWSQNFDTLSDYTGFGFDFRTAVGGTARGYLFSAPFWFLIFVSFAVLFVVWRKTRPAKRGGAFPVEVKSG